MSDIDDKVRTMFATSGISIVGELVRDDASGDIYVQVPSSVNEDGKRSPSRETLLSLKAAFETLEIKVHLLLVNAQVSQFEAMLRSTLFLAFPDMLRNVFCSITGKSALIWIEPKLSLTPEQRAAIAQSAQKFCEAVNLEFDGLTSIGEANTPGKLAILSALRLVAPATIEKLNATLVTQGFKIPSQDWLNRKLDLYRKSKNLLFNTDKTYALTLQSLRQLGTSKLGRRSADVARLLALWKHRS